MMDEKEYIFDEEIFAEYFVTKIGDVPDEETIAVFKVLAKTMIALYNAGRNQKEITEIVPYMRK